MYKEFEFVFRNLKFLCLYANKKIKIKNQEGQRGPFQLWSWIWHYMQRQRRAGFAGRKKYWVRSFLLASAAPPIDWDSDEEEDSFFVSPLQVGPLFSGLSFCYALPYYIMYYPNLFLIYCNWDVGPNSIPIPNHLLLFAISA